MVDKIIYLTTAVRDLRSVYNYISQDSIKYAELEIKKIKAYCESLVYHPTKGKVYGSVKGKEIRSVNFKNYMIFYHIADDELIQVLTIHHHSRSIANNPVFKDDL